MRPADAPGNRLLATGRLVPAELDAATIARVVDRFYARVREDHLLWPIFAAAIPEEEWARHLGTMREFWSSLLLGTRSYEGRPLPKHLALPGLDTAHFERWLALFAEVTAAECSAPIAALFIDRAERIAHSFRLGLAFQRGEDTMGVEPLRVRNTS